GRPAQVAFGLQSPCQIQTRIEMGRIDSKRFTKFSNGIIESALGQKPCAQPVPRRGTRRLNAQRLLEVRNGLAVFSACRQQRFQEADWDGGKLTRLASVCPSRRS